MKRKPWAYENYLVNQSKKIIDNNPDITSPIEVIAAMLYEDCKKQHGMAFDIVGEVSETNWSIETFESAAKNVLDRVNNPD